MQADAFPDLRSTIESYLAQAGAEGAVDVRAELERARAFVELLQQRQAGARGPTGPADDRLLTLPEVATLLQVPEEHAREMGRRGELPILNVGRYVRVRLSTLRQWIDGNERKGLDQRLSTVLNRRRDRKRRRALATEARPDADGVR